jgi:predicted 3-demethylubiquinone-9 3-methyltransferase (glyoxalase superfamily)
VDSVIISENPIAVIFESSGQRFMCLNGGPQYSFNPAVSFYVTFDYAGELDKSWNDLLEGGTVLMSLDKYAWSERYGWIQDRFGVSWQLDLTGPDDAGRKLIPALMFTGKQNGRAREAIETYTSIFKNSIIQGIFRYGKGEGGTEGHIMHAQFTLENREFIVMDSSSPHQFSFNEAISMVVECETQDEIDYYWSGLLADGEEGQCGWLKDKFGISWQIVPSILGELMSDPSRSARVMNAILQMKKLDVGKLVNA